jgi:hypothetical protein
MPWTTRCLFTRRSSGRDHSPWNTEDRESDDLVSVRLTGLVLALAGVAALAARAGTSSAGAPSRPLAPRFPSDRARWIGTPPSWEALRGRVVLLDVWTFG